MSSPAFASHAWWLASRASGLVALALVTISVALGLTMAGRLTRRPRAKVVINAIHEHAALAGLVAIAVHGVTLLGDPWLNPGVAGIAVPFKMAYRPLWTGMGIIAGYLGAILGLSFYIRRRIGARLWRKAHRLSVLVWAFGVGHALGAGTDASTQWMKWWVLITTPPIVLAFLIRVARSRRPSPAAGRAPRTTEGAQIPQQPRHPRPDRARPQISPRPATVGEEA